MEMLVETIQLLRTKGLRGGMHCIPYVDNINDISSLVLYTKNNLETSYQVERFESPSKKRTIVIYLRGVDSIEKAQVVLKYKVLCIERTSMKSLSDNEDAFYYYDLIGCQVHHVGVPESIGKVQNVQNFGHGDILEVTLLSRKEVLIPFNRESVPVVDIPNKTLYVSTLYS
ncbi:MAG: 16S rRNA processing protein RimM [Candidatus Xenolissoclinum pacificiensis L6]|uniref:Ribosome maturation factor RimM n=1 Tax=Candidatus Xenolissoclinum pacificiensis L6 TaxID=1401685 RepID=W2V1P3_9RICK|nr:MAG: 16S rRNA processing protein RimM [Candidatus Xenolissoclinum pacificiensis L6]